MRVAIGLGSNLGDRFLHLTRAVQILENEILASPRSSQVYESTPWGIKDQPNFLNAVVVGESDLHPPILVNKLKAIEKMMGRVPSEKYGPRIIDLDLLVWGENVFRDEQITVPHLQMMDRDFVILPFRELWSDWRHPESLETVEAIYQKLLKNGQISAKVVAAPLSNKENPSR